MRNECSGSAPDVPNQRNQPSHPNQPGLRGLRGLGGYDAAACPFEVARPVMRQRWERLTFLHWPFDPAVVQRLLPDRLRVETFGGTAWVGLVPFFMRVTTAGGRGMDPLSNFCETNVRTYVRDHEGRTGVWFFSLDATQLGAVVVARTAYRLPYFWSSMTLLEGGRAGGGTGTVAYECHRMAPRSAHQSPRGSAPGAGGRDRTSPSSRVTVRVGEPFRTDELDARDHFLTARWILFSASGSRYRYARAEHSPWPLHRAELLSLDDDLVAAAGLPRPVGQPLVHYSPGVDVRIGRPELYASPAG